MYAPQIVSASGLEKITVTQEAVPLPVYTLVTNQKKQHVFVTIKESARLRTSKNLINQSWVQKTINRRHFSNVAVL